MSASTTTSGRLGRGTGGRPVLEAGPGFLFTVGVDGEEGSGPEGVDTFLGPVFEGLLLAKGCFGVTYLGVDPDLLLGVVVFTGKWLP